MLLQAAAATSAGRQTTAFPPLVGRLHHRRRRAAEQAGPDQRGGREGGREDGARAEEEEEAQAPASIVRSVAVVRPYEVRPSVRRPLLRSSSEEIHPFDCAAAASVSAAVAQGGSGATKMQEFPYQAIRRACDFHGINQLSHPVRKRERESAVTANHR